MKKYKLIKEYPGSPKLGTIWDECSTDCPKYPEFWQEITKPCKDCEELMWTCSKCKKITKPEYTILSLIGIKVNEGIILKEKKEINAYIKNISGNKYWTIHSVRRESDGEVFTIGDMYVDGNPCSYIINKFDFTKDKKGIFVIAEEGGFINLSSITKVKPKEWEITAFRLIGSTWIRPKGISGNFYSGENGCNEFSEKSLLNDISYEIYSVKRLSDGVEFKIGDKVNTKFSISDRNISSFEILDGDLMVRLLTKTTQEPRYYLKDIIKAKQPLFTTAQKEEISKHLDKIKEIISV